MKNQENVFREEINHDEVFGDGSKIIDANRHGQNWFAKGHLSPDAAFLYDFEKFATYFYINVDPQFQAFNANNWASVESEARMLAKT